MDHDIRDLWRAYFAARTATRRVLRGQAEKRHQHCLDAGEALPQAQLVEAAWDRMVAEAQLVEAQALGALAVVLPLEQLTIAAGG